MSNVLLVGVGGFIGAVSRYLLGGWVHTVLDKPGFPIGTLIVNALGCFLIGFIGEVLEVRQLFTLQLRCFLFVGLLGGFTTFSAFSYETLALMRSDQMSTALLNIFLQLVLCISFVILGYLLAKQV